MTRGIIARDCHSVCEKLRSVAAPSDKPVRPFNSRGSWLRSPRGSLLQDVVLHARNSRHASALGTLGAFSVSNGADFSGRSGSRRILRRRRCASRATAAAGSATAARCWCCSPPNITAPPRHTGPAPARPPRALTRRRPLTAPWPPAAYEEARAKWAQRRPRRSTMWNGRGAESVPRSVNFAMP